MVAHRVKERLAHIVSGAVEHYRLSAMLIDELIHGVAVSRGKYFVAVIAQRERQQLSDLRRVVNEQDAPQASYFFAGPVPGSRGFLAAQGSRSITQMRPPAV
jgi:hypothetical protein